MNPVYGTNHPLGGGKSLLTSHPKQGKMKKPTGKSKKAKVSKRLIAQLESHSMQYMTKEQREDTTVTMEMDGKEYTFVKDEDYIIDRVISVVNFPVRHGKEKRMSQAPNLKHVQETIDWMTEDYPYIQELVDVLVPYAHSDPQFILGVVLHVYENEDDVQSLLEWIQEDEGVTRSTILGFSVEMYQERHPDEFEDE